jgi:CheY-like chemotaxis protein
MAGLARLPSAFASVSCNGERIWHAEPRTVAEFSLLRCNQERGRFPLADRALAGSNLSGCSGASRTRHMNSNGHIPNQRILVIDDNPAIHEDFRKIFGVNKRADALKDAEASLFGEASPRNNRLAFEIESAYQGQEGLDRIRQSLQENRPYGMAFVDVRMPPGWDGIETIRRIWSEYPDLQVAICTAYSDYSLEDMLNKLGRTDRLVLLKKPFDNLEVLQLAHTLTEKWNLHQQSKTRGPFPRRLS